MAKPVVAIVGKPNVGKSTFFNYLIGERKSIVEDQPGVTRDRIYAEATWRDKTFTVIDTGGIEEKKDDEISKQMVEQAKMAIDIADVILFMTDIKTGVTIQDHEVAKILRRSNKKIILVCNKVDDFRKYKNEIYEFYNLGIGDPVPLSSTNALGMGDLLDLVYESIKDFEEDFEPEKIKVAIIGKPNVGKSSLINNILNENRVIVSNIAGTTRDAIDVEFENEFGKYVFIDTAGMRRKSKVDEKLEIYSNIRTKSSIEKSDVSILLIDATEGVTEQDAKIAGEAHESGKGIIIVINKWDLVEKENGTLEKYTKEVYNKLAYLKYAPILFISAKTGQRVHKLFELINTVYENNNLRIKTSTVNSILNEAIAIVQPPSDKGKRLKIYYMTQIGVKPPTFAVFVNSKKLFHFSYERYLINKLRAECGFTGTSIKMIIREKGEK